MVNDSSEIQVKEFLTPAETQRLEEAATCLRDQLLIRLLRKLGCRISEILGVKVGQINWSEKMISIVHEKQRIKRLCPHCETRLAKSFKLCPECGKNVEAAIQKSNLEVEYRGLPVDDSTLKILRDYANFRVDKEKATKPEDVKLFQLSRQRAWEIIKKCAEDAGLPKIINTKKQRVHNVSPHKLRDAFATNVLNKDSSNESMKHLQEHLGHKRIDTTMGYTKTTGASHKEWLEKINGDGEEKRIEPE